MTKLSILDETLVTICERAIEFGTSYPNLAKCLTMLGYQSARGKTLTNSHVSNFMCDKLDVRCVREYEKPGYKGRNHIIDRKKRQMH